MYDAYFNGLAGIGLDQSVCEAIKSSLVSLTPAAGGTRRGWLMSDDMIAWQMLRCGG